MNKKRFLVEFDESLKTYKSLDIPIPTVQIQDDTETDDYRFCEECNTDYLEGENCNC
jgi:hypothetical protein